MELAKYVRLLADELGLREWALVLSATAPDTGTQAQVTTVRGRRTAVLRVAADLTGNDLREALVHELLHVHVASMADVVSDMDNILDATVFQLVWAWYEREAERTVEALARAIASRMPIPD